ncbi:hypothetical protein MACK_000550 [Theileria orientalis]|uniref:Uncharacterized protein n=1 Tax=Theileria orientalis TaxID=68886 RepID=A0A976QU25_THEOR|nr:hypothetical protein MACK_000550 [Theileria orientalis]
MDDQCPLPYVDFAKFCEYQSNLLMQETDIFFENHNLRLKKYILPVTLPEWAKSFGDVLDRGEEYDPLTTIYRHRHFLKCRILHNYSYIETKWNRSSDIRNKNIPFDLRPLTSEILNQLDIINEDMLDPEFSGLLVTLNTAPYMPVNESLYSSNDESGDSNSTGSSEGVTENKMSKIIAGALVECLITNERCIKSIWLHPSMTKHSSRILLQSFLPRLMYEIFMLPSVMTENGVSEYNKFTYCMHNDLDLFPRQCWLLLASNRKMSLPRHYEPSTFEEHPVQLEYGDCHTDEVGYLYSQASNPSEMMERLLSKTDSPSELEEEITLSKNDLIKLNGKEMKNETGQQKEEGSESGAASADESNGTDEPYEEKPQTVRSEKKDKNERAKRPRRSCAVTSYVSTSTSNPKSSKESNKDSNSNSNSNTNSNSNSNSKHGSTSKESSGNKESNNGKETNTKESPNGSTIGNKRGGRKTNKQNTQTQSKKQKRGGNEEQVGGEKSKEKSSNTTMAQSTETKEGPEVLSNEGEGATETKRDFEKLERVTKMMSNDSFRQLRDLFTQVGSINSTRDVSCSCRREKLKKSVDDQAWLDRLVGCTENYMYLMLPKRQERARLGLLVRDGWRDLVVPNLDPILLQDINNILPEHARAQLILPKNQNNVNYNADVEEWCRLKREDLIDVTSDTEVYMRLPDNADH